MFRTTNDTALTVRARVWLKKMAVDAAKAFGSEEEFAKALAYEQANKR